MFSRLMQLLRIEYKRTAISYCHILLSLIIMTVGVGAVSTGAAYLYYQSLKNKPVQIGIAVNDESEEMALALKLVTSMGVVRSLCTFIETDEEGIVDGVANGDLNGGIILSDNFYSDINTGINTPARVVLPDDSSLSSGLLSDFLSAGVSMIDTAEAGIYAVTDAASIYDMKLTRTGMEELLTRIYAESVLRRGEFFDTKVLSPLGEFNIFDYYTSSALVLIILLTGIYFGFLFSNENSAVEDKLAIYGITSIHTGIVRIFVMTGFVFLTGLSLRLEAYFIFRFLNVNVDRISAADILCLIPVSISVAAFFYFVFTLGEEVYKARIMLLMLIVIMLLAGGFLIPIDYLPEWGQTISYCLPATVYRSFILEVQKSSLEAGTALGVVLYALFFFAAGIGVRWKKR